MTAFIFSITPIFTGRYTFKSSKTKIELQKQIDLLEKNCVKIYRKRKNLDWKIPYLSKSIIFVAFSCSCALSSAF